MNKIIQVALNREKTISLILSIFYLFGIFFHAWTKTNSIVIGLTEATIFLSNGLVLFYLFIQGKSKQKLLWWILLTVSITIVVEIVGVYTGKIFGTYHYGDTMSLKIAGVPIVIGINWAILILASFQLSSKISRFNLIRPFIAGIIIVIFDYIMEPVAMKLDYWQWENNTIPLQNYLTWFILATIFSFLMILLKIKTNSKILILYFFIQFIFFSALNLFLK